MNLALNQKLQQKPLACSTLNNLQNQIEDVQLIILDEVSMVGFKMFNCIHQRLMKVNQYNKQFGDVSLIVVGYIFQLKPVYDSFIFRPLNQITCRWLITYGKASSK